MFVQCFFFKFWGTHSQSPRRRHFRPSSPGAFRAFRCLDWDGGAGVGLEVWGTDAGVNLWGKNPWESVSYYGLEMFQMRFGQDFFCPKLVKYVQNWVWILDRSF
jgi:hypothetical protein